MAYLAHMLMLLYEFSEVMVHHEMASSLRSSP
jgi:hypothetical protein